MLPCIYLRIYYISVYVCHIEEELNRRNTTSRIVPRHFVFLLPCALFRFHHKSATLRLFVAGLRLICCPFLSFCNGLQEPSEATSVPCGTCKGKMEHYGTWFSNRRLMFNVDNRTRVQCFPISPALINLCKLKCLLQETALPGSSEYIGKALASEKRFFHMYKLSGSLISCNYSKQAMYFSKTCS